MKNASSKQAHYTFFPKNPLEHHKYYKAGSCRVKDLSPRCEMKSQYWIPERNTKVIQEPLWLLRFKTTTQCDTTRRIQIPLTPLNCACQKSWSYGLVVTRGQNAAGRRRLRRSSQDCLLGWHEIRAKTLQLQRKYKRAPNEFIVFKKW